MQLASSDAQAKTLDVCTHSYTSRPNCYVYAYSVFNFTQYVYCLLTVYSWPQPPTVTGSATNRNGCVSI